jgi:hypothetical protein
MNPQKGEKMLPTKPMMSDLLMNTAIQMIRVALAEKIENPYLRAALETVSQTLMESVRLGLSPEETEKQIQSVFPDQQKINAENRVPPDTTRTLIQALG